MDIVIDLINDISLIGFSHSFSLFVSPMTYNPIIYAKYAIHIVLTSIAYNFYNLIKTIFILFLHTVFMTLFSGKWCVSKYEHQTNYCYIFYVVTINFLMMLLF